MLEVEGGLNANTRVVVNKSALSQDELSASQNEAGGAMDTDDVMDDDELARKQQLEEMIGQSSV